MTSKNTEESAQQKLTGATLDSNVLATPSVDVSNAATQISPEALVLIQNYRAKLAELEKTFAELQQRIAEVKEQYAVVQGAKQAIYTLCGALYKVEDPEQAIDLADGTINREGTVER
jgi:hypothetical protein